MLLIGEALQLLRNGWDDLLYVIDRLHHIYLTRQLFGLPVYTSNVASSATKQQVTEGKKTSLTRSKNLKHTNIFT